MLPLAELSALVDSKIILAEPLLTPSKSESVSSQLSDAAQEAMGIRQSRSDKSLTGEDQRRWRSWSPPDRRRDAGLHKWLSKDAVQVLLSVKQGASQAAAAAADAADKARAAVRHTRDSVFRCLCLELKVVSWSHGALADDVEVGAGKAEAKSSSFDGLPAAFGLLMLATFVLIVLLRWVNTIAEGRRDASGGTDG